MKQFMSLLLVFSAIFIFSACGSDSSGSTSSPSVKLSFSGVVVDGYIRDSRVCVDLNLNSVCDTDEPTTTSSESGIFSFSNIETKENDFIAVIASGGVDSATGKNFIGEFKTTLYAKNVSSDKYYYLTPLSDLVTINFLNTHTRSEDILNNSRNLIANAYTIGEAYVDQNPMAYAGVYSRTQEIQQTVGLLETASLNKKAISLTLLERVQLREAIKLALTSEISETGTLNLVNTITNLEQLTGLSFTDSEKTFLNDQLREIKLSIDSFVTHTDLTAYNLNNYQIALENEADKIYEAIDALDVNSTPEVIPVNINIDEILAIVPDNNKSDDNVTLPDPGDSSAEPSSSTVNISFGGYIVDDYIDGATICMDFNYNLKCDSREPFAVSSENGSYIFSNIEVTKDSVIVLTGFSGVDKATGVERWSELKSIVDVNSSGTINNISPITDYIATDFLSLSSSETNSTSRTLYQESVTRVGLGFDINSTALFSDPMQNVSMFMLSQELEYRRRILENILEQDITVSLQNEIKKAILAQLLEVGYTDISMDRIITTLELNLGLLVSDSNRNFAIEQMKEIERVLDEMNASEEIQPYTLSTLQVKMEESLSKPLDTLGYSDINLTSEIVSYSEFSKTDAIYDAKACLVDAEYVNTLLDTNATKFTADEINGFAIGTNEDEIVMFYPNVQNNLKGDSVTLFFDDNNFFSFDKAWSSTNQNIYLKLPKGTSNKYECYRMTLNFDEAKYKNMQKVFRYTEIK